MNLKRIRVFRIVPGESVHVGRGDYVRLLNLQYEHWHINTSNIVAIVCGNRALTNNGSGSNFELLMRANEYVIVTFSERSPLYEGHADAYAMMTVQDCIDAFGFAPSVEQKK